MHPSGSEATEFRVQHPDDLKHTTSDFGLQPNLSSYSDHFQNLDLTFSLLHTLNHGPRSSLRRTAASCIQKERSGEEG
jgi:hypothetical protein